MTDNIQLPIVKTYWKMKRKIFPNRTSVVQLFLAAPLSNVSCERQFKVGESLITETRFRMLPHNAEMLIWLN